MAYELSATQARTVTTTDMVIYNEIDTLSRAIIAAALDGNLQVTVDDGTTMTESTPTIVITGTESDPVTASGETDEELILNGTTITFPYQSNINSIVGLINDAAIVGLVASKNADNQLVLTFQCPQNDWTFTIGDTTANNTVGITAGIVAATTPGSVAYYNMWAGIQDDRKKAYEFAQVVNHFQNLGYNILAKKNTVTENTLLWEIYW